MFDFTTNSLHLLQLLYHAERVILPSNSGNVQNTILEIILPGEIVIDKRGARLDEIKIESTNRFILVKRLFIANFESIKSVDR